MEVEIRGYIGTIYQMIKYEISTKYKIVLSAGADETITLDKVKPEEIKILNKEEEI